MDANDTVTLRSLLALFGRAFEDPETYVGRQPDDVYLRDLLSSRHFVAIVLMSDSTVAGGLATVATYGIISGSGARNDVDMFRIDLGAGGEIDLTVNAWTRAYVGGSATPVETASPFSMLDAALVLYDASFQQVAAWNDLTRIDGVMELSGLAAGTYYLALDGVGWGDPTAATPTGYTEYGSLGQYMIRGTYSVGGALPPVEPPPPPPWPLPIPAARGTAATACKSQHRPVRLLGTVSAPTHRLSPPTRGSRR